MNTLSVGWGWELGRIIVPYHSLGNCTVILLMPNQLAAEVSSSVHFVCAKLSNVRNRSGDAICRSCHRITLMEER